MKKAARGRPFSCFWGIFSVFRIIQIFMTLKFFVGYGQRIKWAVENSGASVRKVAISAGMAPASLEYLLKSHPKRKSRYHDALASVLDVSPEWLWSGDPRFEPMDRAGIQVRLNKNFEAMADDQELEKVCAEAVELYASRKNISYRQAIRVFLIAYRFFSLKSDCHVSVQDVIEAISYFEAGFSGCELSAR